LKKIIAITVITGLFISTIIFVNVELIVYREKEILFNLDIISKQLKDIKTTSLLARYKLIKNRIKNGEQEKDYIIESRIQGLLNSTYNSPINLDRNNIFLKKPIEFITKNYLKTIRFFLGKKMPETIYADYNNPFLELAFFYERYRKYDKAIDVMNNVAKTKKNLSSFSWRFILLHSGFCYSMLSKYVLSRKSYKMLIRLYPGSNEAETAKLLLEYLDVLDKGTNSIVAQSIPKIEKAEKLYFLSSYKKAKFFYDEIIKSGNLSTSDHFRARFYRGRSSEELGYNDIAIDDYKNIIKNIPGSSWAKKSNLRLMVLGSFYGEGSYLVNFAKKTIRNPKEKRSFIVIDEIKTKMLIDTFPYKKVSIRYKAFKENFDKDSSDKDFIFTINNIEANNDERAVTLRNFHISSRKSKAGNFNLISKKILFESSQKLIGKQVQIKSKDGFIFSGEIIHEDSSSIIIKSEFGEIPLKKNMIQEISNIQ